MSLSETPVERPPALTQIEEHAVTGHQRSLIGLAITANVAEFFDMFVIGFVISDLSKPWHLTFLQASLILLASGLGTIIGSIVWGRLADRIGRKTALYATVATFTVFTGISVFTPDRAWWLLALLRVFVGIGVGGLNIVSIPMVQEFVPAKQRGWLSGLASVFIPLGLLLGSLSTKYLLDSITWRGLIALGVLPILLVLWIRKVPESPHWLVSKGRTDEARAAIAWALEMPVDRIGTVAAHQGTPKSGSYGTILRRYPRALAVVVLGSFCFITGSVVIQSWGQTLLVESRGISVKEAANWFIWISIASLIGRMLTAYLADRVGRRWILFVTGIAAAVCDLWAAYSGNGSLGPVPILFLAMAFAMFFGDGAFGILNAYGAEMFPDDVRATGLGLGYGLGALGKVFGPMLLALVSGSTNLVSPEATESAIKPAFLVMSALLVVGGVVYLAGRETRGKLLEERRA